MAPRVKAQTQTQSRAAKVCKNVLHTIGMVSAALILPSFACLVLGPIGLIAPAVLACIALTCLLLGGKPTEQMARAQAERAVEMSQYDPR